MKREEKCEDPGQPIRKATCSLLGLSLLFLVCVVGPVASGWRGQPRGVIKPQTVWVARSDRPFPILVPCR